MNHRCIVNVATGHGRWFPRGQDRLSHSLNKHDPESHQVLFYDIPPESPTHAEAPYAFKTFAIQEALRRGYTSILWLDASMWAVRSLEPLWEEIEEHGSTFFRCGWGVGDYSNDRGLEILGVTRDEAMSIPLVLGGIYGLDLTNVSAAMFQARMLRYAKEREIFRGAWDNKSQQCSEDPRCLGHRHDMVPMAALVQKLDLHIVNCPRLYALPTPEWPEPDGHPDAVILARGM